MTREDYMKEALTLAKEAAQAGEVPVGCVIVRDGEIIGRGRNRREEKQAVSSHAEMEAMAQANAVLGSWRLEDCDLYVTLEPCPMCAGAIANSRIDTVIIGAREEKSGAYGSALDINSTPINHKPEVIFSVTENECAALLRDFFKRKRERGKRRTKE